MRVARSSRARAGCVTGCLVRLMVAVAVAGLLVLILMTVLLVRSRRIAPEIVRDPPIPSAGARVAVGPALSVPPSGDTPGGLLVYTTDQDTANLSLSYLDGDPPAIRWNTDVPGDQGAWVSPVLARDTVYLASGARLQALSLPGGARRWSAALPADIPPGCAACIQPLDGAVAVLTSDRTLSLFNAEDGAPRWQVTLHALPRDVRVIDGSPAVVDTLPVTDSSALLVFDAQTGAERYRILPRCESGGAVESLSPASPLLYDAAAGALYFLFGFEQHGCAQRWDAATGQPVWSAMVPLAASGWPRAWTMSGPLLGDSAIYLAGDDGQSVLSVDVANGALRTLARSDTFALDPWAVDSGTLLVHAELRDSALDNRASDELWGLDAATGRRLWRYPVARNNLSWAAHRAPGRFVVVQLLPDPARLYVALLDARRGVPLRARTLPLASAAWTGSTWDDHTAWLTIGALVAIDLSTGVPAQVWPLP